MSERGPLDFGPEDEDRAPREDEAPRDAEPPRDDVPVPRPAGASRYGWFVGVAVVLLIAVVTLNTFRSEGRGARGVQVGERLPAFAAPLAFSSFEDDADVNIATEAGQGDAGERPACRVRGRGVLNVCALAERGPVVLAFLATRGGDCERPLDSIERIRDRHPGVQFAAVSIRGDRGDLRERIRDAGWGFPVAYDHDGVLANLYSVAVCPQITFAAWRGEVLSTSFGTLTAEQLDVRIRRLVTISREHGWTAPAG